MSTISEVRNPDIELTNNLYKRVYDPRQTQLAFALKYFPYASLRSGVRAHIRKSSMVTLTKDQLLSSMDETLTNLQLGGNTFQVVWMNNNIPTETEWNSIKSDGQIEVELRETNLHGNLAILRLHWSNKHGTF